MKYKVGDVVRVRKDLSADGTCYRMEHSKEGTFANLDMEGKHGKLVTIKRLEDGMYRIEEDDFWWTDGMFEGLVCSLNTLDRYSDACLSRKIRKVMYNPPATIVWFGDGDKIVSVADKGDKYDWKHGLALCILKKRMPKNDYNRFYPYFDRRDMIVKRDANGEVCRDKKGKVRYIKNAPLWDVLVRKYCPNGEWEKIKKEWKK